jgi:hypothetical protein
VLGVLWLPEQQLGEFVGLPSRLAEHALLQPTDEPEESKGPFKGFGQFGARSIAQSAMGQSLLVVILIGRLYPSTRETSYQSCDPSP